MGALADLTRERCPMSAIVRTGRHMVGLHALEFLVWDGGDGWLFSQYSSRLRQLVFWGFVL